MGRTESSLATDTVELIDKVGVPLVWTIIEGVTVMYYAGLVSVVGVADMGKRRRVRKVVVALGDDLVHPTGLERSGVCTGRGQESRDDKRKGLDSRHLCDWWFA